ncbi:hypothetical protein KTR9_4291 [Gordonia sp. KTR9]|nr:hypothetical protein KTR9_4291 [Gordonia sp. KTR9]
MWDRIRAVRDSLRGVTNSPYQSGDPRFGPLPPSGQYPPHPGFQPPTQPYGAPPPYGGPIAGGMYPPGPPFPPQRTKKRAWVWVSLVVIAVVVAVSAFLIMSKMVDSLPPSAAITTSDDVAVGECVRVSASEGYLDAERVPCGTKDFHFVVADKVIDESNCGPEYSRYWFVHARPGTSETLCVAQVYQQGRCYHEPGAVGGTALAEIREIDCDGPVLKPGATNFRVDTKVSREPTCDPGQGLYYVPKPTPAGYCVSLLE